MKYPPIVAFGLLVAFAANTQHVIAATKGADNLPLPSHYEQRLASARAAYFQDLQGDHLADATARQKFSELNSEHPGDPVVLAYTGSLDLLEAGRTWAFWNKHTLAQQGLQELDRAVNLAPDNLEARFIRAATTWHLPFLFHRKQQAENDFAFIAPRAERAARNGTLPPQLAAAALDYYGQVLANRSDMQGAKQSYETAMRIDRTSPGGKDASKRLKGE